MARQFRTNSDDIYTKLCGKAYSSPMKTSRKRTRILPESDDITIGEGFYITEAKTHRTHSAEVVKKNDRYLVKFDKQTPRPEFASRALQVHENRFITYNDCPPCSTRHRPVNSPRFSYYLGRKEQRSQNAPKDYSPSFLLVERNAKQGLVPFDKTQGRVEVTKTDPQLDKLVVIDFSKLDPHVASPSLEKSSPRNLGFSLPLFMINTGDRGANYSIKSLEMNQYMQGEFMPLSSTFGSGWKQPPSGYPIPVKGRCPKIVKILKEKLKIT